MNELSYSFIEALYNVKTSKHKKYKIIVNKDYAEEFIFVLNNGSLHSTIKDDLTNLLLSKSYRIVDIFGEVLLSDGIKKLLELPNGFCLVSNDIDEDPVFLKIYNEFDGKQIEVNKYIKNNNKFVYPLHEELDRTYNPSITDLLDLKWKVVWLEDYIKNIGD